MNIIQNRRRCPDSRRGCPGTCRAPQKKKPLTRTANPPTVAPLLHGKPLKANVDAPARQALALGFRARKRRGLDAVRAGSIEPPRLSCFLRRLCRRRFHWPQGAGVSSGGKKFTPEKISSPLPPAFAPLLRNAGAPGFSGRRP